MKKSADTASELRSGDAELLRSFSSGSKEGFAAFYDRFAGILFATTSRILGDGKPAEEALQEAFVQMWRRSSQFDAARGSLFAWAVMIARNEAVRRLRSSRGPIQLFTADSSRRVTRRNGAPFLYSQEQSDVRAGLAFLTSVEQEALELCFFEGLTAFQVSRKLGIPPEKLGATVQRGLFGFLHALSNGTAGPLNRPPTKEAPVASVTADAA